MELIRLPQDQDTPPRSERNAAFAWRYAFARARDTRAAGENGQDYLTLLPGEGAFAFALCDGVSQSFYGDIASRFLGDALLDWLSTELPATLDRAEIAGSLAPYLRALTLEATEQVQRQPLPSHLPPMLADVLEEKRKLGSESTFVCGGVEVPSREFPDGRLVLAWMGDSRLRLWAGDAEGTSQLGDSFDTAQRWSSRRGPVGGEPNLFVGTLREAPGLTLLAYSDGLAPLDDSAIPPSDETLRAEMAKADASPASDDISFLELSLASEA
jgi:hypothetical protein